VAYAASIACAFDADLTTLYAVDSVWSEHPLAMAQSPDAAAILLQVQERRLQEARAGYERAAKSIGGRLHWKEAGFLDPESAVTLHARAADLVILAQADPNRSVKTSTPRHLVESVVIDSGCPALVVPYIGAAPTTGDVVEVTARPCGAASAQIGEAMLSMASDCSADLLVMGCYGHSRARERVLGGATRSILDSMTLPVLMAH